MGRISSCVVEIDILLPLDLELLVVSGSMMFLLILLISIFMELVVWVGNCTPLCEEKGR